MSLPFEHSFKDESFRLTGSGSIRAHAVFALNLYNSSEVAPSLIKAVTEVVTLLGPARFHVSVFENGSPDATPTQLLLFAKALEALGAGYSITSDVDRPSGYEAYKRIPALAELRNLALKPLYDAPKGTFDRVIFINDGVWSCMDGVALARAGSF